MCGISIYLYWFLFWSMDIVLFPFIFHLFYSVNLLFCWIALNYYFLLFILYILCTPFLDVFTFSRALYFIIYVVSAFHFAGEAVRVGTICLYIWQSPWNFTLSHTNLLCCRYSSHNSRCQHSPFLNHSDEYLNRELELYSSL